MPTGETSEDRPSDPHFDLVATYQRDDSPDSCSWYNDSDTPTLDQYERIIPSSRKMAPLKLKGDHQFTYIFSDKVKHRLYEKSMVTQDLADYEEKKEIKIKQSP